MFAGAVNVCSSLEAIAVVPAVSVATATELLPVAAPRTTRTRGAADSVPAAGTLSRYRSTLVRV